MEGSWSVKRAGGVATLTIDRPPYNLVSVEDVLGLGMSLAELRQDPDVRAVVLTGAGDAFIGGSDLSRLGEAGAAEARFALQAGQRVLRDIEELEKPVLAAVNGAAFGPGFEIALACDIRICSEEARFALPEVGYGLIPGWGATQRLARMVGLGRAKELVMTGRVVGSAEALQVGLVSQVAPAAGLTGAAAGLAGMLASRAPVAMALAKEMVNASAECSIPLGAALEAAACSITMTTEDCLEGVRALLERREPRFKGR